MSKEEYNNQVITEYLFGELPTAEAERLDELSFTDEEFASALKSVENDLVDSYVGGELRGAQLETFESYYLASPKRRQKVEFARSLQNYAEAAQTNKINLASANSNQKKTGGVFSGFKIFAVPNGFVQWGFAAAALLLVFLAGWLWTENIRLNQQTNEIEARRDALEKREQELQNQLAQERVANSAGEKELAQASQERTRLEQEIKTERARQQQQVAVNAVEQARLKKQTDSSLPPKISIASFILLPPVRGNNLLETVSIPAQTSFVRMQLQLESDDYNSYRVALTDGSGKKTLWQSGKVIAKTKGENKSVNVRFPAKLLKAQTYLLTVSGVSKDGAIEIVGGYSFRVVR